MNQQKETTKKIKFTAVLWPWRLVWDTGKSSFATMETILDKHATRGLIFMVISLIIFWHIYTPIHELLHAGAAFLTGGDVQELEIKAQYGGQILAEIFPFVTSGGEYAGRLSGFSVPNHWAYAVVDLAPYILSLFGFFVLDRSRRRADPWLFGVGIVLAFIPIMSIPGDYFELISLPLDSLAGMLDPNYQAGTLIADDWFKAVGEQWGADGSALIKSFQIIGLIGAVWAAALTVTLSTYIACRQFKAELVKPAPAAKKAVTGQVET